MLPNSSLKRIYRFPSGKRARATRAVSSGMGGRAWGCNDIGLLLLVGSLVILTLFRLFYHLLLLPLLPFANRVESCQRPAGCRGGCGKQSEYARCGVRCERLVCCLSSTHRSSSYADRCPNNLTACTCSTLADDTDTCSHGPGFSDNAPLLRTREAETST